MSCACIIIDCNACNWGALVERHGANAFNSLITSIVAFCNAHLALSMNNHLLLLAAAPNVEEKVLYSSCETPQRTNVAKNIESTLRKILGRSANVAKSGDITKFASTLSLAICFAERCKRELANGFGRVLMISLTNDLSIEQNILMNLFFAARQHNIVVDVASLGNPIPILQQAADITSGTHMFINKPEDLLKDLMMQEKSICSIVTSYDQKIIFDLLSSYDGTKAIVWDRKLMKLMNADKRLHHVMFIPEVSHVLREKLKSFKEIESISNLPIRWFPTENPAFVTLSQPNLVYKILIDEDWLELYKCANALYQLERRTGQIPTIRCKGEWSAKIVEMLKKIRMSNEKELEIGEKLEIDEIVIIDRWLDPITPLLTQLTFGGCIDEFFGIDVLGKVRVPSDVDNENAQTSSNHVEILLSNDELYDQLQDQFIYKMGTKIREITKDIGEEESQLQMLSVAEMKIHIKSLPKLIKKRKSVNTFTRLAEIIQSELVDDFIFQKILTENEILNGCSSDRMIPFIENSIIEALSMIKVLRLICLHSQICNGLKPSTIQSYRKLFIQSYGVGELGLWIRLQLAGLIREEESDKLECKYIPVNFTFMNRQMKLISSDYGENTPKDISYAYSGYASLLVRHIESGFHNGWRDWTTINGSIPVTRSSMNRLLFVVGGITRAEMSCIRGFLPKLQYCASTSIISGDQFIQAFQT